MPDQDNAPSAPQSATAPAAGDEEPTTPAGLRKILSQTEQELQELRQDAERVSAKVQEFVRKTKDVEKVQGPCAIVQFACPFSFHWVYVLLATLGHTS